MVGPAFGAVSGTTSVKVALGDGAGGLTRKTFTNFGTSQAASITTADFNSDGKLDLAVTRLSDRRVYFLINDGTGGFPTDAASLPNLSAGLLVSAIKAADINNDTKSDLVVMAAS